MGFWGGAPGSGIRWLLAKCKDKPAYHQQIDCPETALHIVCSHKELAALCEESQQLHPQVQFYWQMYSAIVEAPCFPDDGEVEADADDVSSLEECAIVPRIVQQCEMGEHIEDDAEDAGEEQP